MSISLIKNTIEMVATLNGHQLVAEEEQSLLGARVLYLNCHTCHMYIAYGENVGNTSYVHTTLFHPCGEEAITWQSCSKQMDEIALLCGCEVGMFVMGDRFQVSKA